MTTKSTGRVSAKVLAGVLAIITALGIIVLGSKAGFVGQVGGGTVAAPAGSTLIVSAAHDLAAGAHVVAEDLTTVAYLPGTEPKRSYTDRAALVGRWVLNPITNASPLVQDDISDSKGGLPLNTEPNSVGKNASLTVPAGYLAIALPTAGIGTTGGTAGSALNNVGNFVQPGDRLDIIGDPGNGVVQFLFQDVAVLKVGSNGTAATGVPDVLVVLLPRDQAVRLTQLLTSPTTKALKYVLRGKADSGLGPQSDGGVITPAPATSAAVPSPTG